MKTIISNDTPITITTEDDESNSLYVGTAKQTGNWLTNSEYTITYNGQIRIKVYTVNPYANESGNFYLALTQPVTFDGLFYNVYCEVILSRGEGRRIFTEKKEAIDFDEAVQDKIRAEIYDDATKTFKLAKDGSGNCGYIKNGSFVAFKSQADIDAAVSAAKKGNAAASDVLSGKTFTNSSTSGATGTMANRGAVSQSLNPNGSYTIPQGYHDGNGKVTAKAIQNATINQTNFSWTLDQNTGRKWTGNCNTNHSTCFAAMLTALNSTHDFDLSVNINSSVITVVTNNKYEDWLYPNFTMKYFYY